jgi:SNF2 family DNA or RNA helicase
MQPFFLRRIKSEVLTDLPQMSEEVIQVPMAVRQQKVYFQLVADYKQRAKEVICISSFVLSFYFSRGMENR